MTDQATHTTTAGGSPLDGGVRPRAWAIFVDGGNARMWLTLQPHVQKLADAYNLEVTPLYDQAALDAVRADERQKCVEWCRQVQRHHEAKPKDADELEQEFVDGEACGAEDCTEAIQSEGAWP